MLCQTIQNKTLAENREQNITNPNKNGGTFDELFNQNWEFFVVKLDEKTGKFVGKVACCALQPV